MNRRPPDRARRLAPQLDLRFGDDAWHAAQLKDAQPRLPRLLLANDRLWSGLRPDGMAAIYGEHHAAVEAASANNRSEILGAPDPLRQAHWTIHHSFVEYQAAADRRRLLTVVIGELAGELIATLVAAGWSEQEAREANVLDFANARQPGHHRTA